MPSKIQGAIPPPEGVQPNLVNPQSQLQTVWLVATVMILVVPSILVLLRLYVKIQIVKKLTLADGACVLAWALLVALAGVGISLHGLGVGLHSWDLTIEKYSKYAERINIHQIIYQPAIFFTKAAVLLQFVDIFVTRKRNLRWWMMYILIIVNAVAFTIFLFLEIYECNPRRKIWTPSIPGSCINIQKTFVAAGALNVLDDFLILFLPIGWVWKLQIPTRRKLGVAVIFATGILACVSSVLRLEESIKSVDSEDITYILMPVALWANAEVACGLVVCCLPVLPRLSRVSAKNSKAKSNYPKSLGPTTQSKNPSHEMNDEVILLGQLPRSQLRVDTKVQCEYPDDTHHDMGRDGQQFRPDPPSAIYRTISIKQTSEMV